MLAQDAVVKGRVVDINSNEVIPDVDLSIENSIFTTATDTEGLFSITSNNLPQGEQILVVLKEGYFQQRIPININAAKTIDLDPILLKIDFSSIEQQIGIISLSDNELDEDEGTSFNISGLLQSSRDVFLNAAAYDFSTTFFRPRGYDSENGTVLINGIEMNKIYDGRPQWANWGGVNDAQRNQEFSMGMSTNDYIFGDLAGTTNIIMRASQYRKGGRVSYASSNRSYRGRVMGSYNTGLSANGWAYSILVSRRFGEEGFTEGTLYDANSFFASVEKKLNEKHSLNFTSIYAPNRRGKSAPNTQEVIDAKGIDYNPYWGEQDGEIRNSRIKEVEEPILFLNHYWDITKNTSLNTNASYQFGHIGNSRLGYDNVPNPDPTFYQKLPSFFLANPDGPDLAGAFRAQRELAKDGQIDWQNIYENNVFFGGTSRYYLYEDRNDDNTFSANTIFRSKINDNITLNGSLSYRNLKSKNFANLTDLLGGNGYLDVDSFNQGPEAQSDLNNPDRVIFEGDTFKYNYEIEANVYKGFAQAQFIYKNVEFYLGGNVGKTDYQRNGLYKNGSFPNANDSFGKSDDLNFTTYGGKAGVTYKISGKHLLDVNSAYFTNAPTIRNSFSNARQNNNIVDGLTEETTKNLDVSYIFRSPLVKGRLTGYYSTIEDASEVSFYYADGISPSGGGRLAQDNFFIQEVLTDIDKKFIGGEFGLEAQVTPTIKLKAIAAYGQNTYANNPNLYITSDDEFVIFEEGENVNNINTRRIDFGQSYLKDYKISGGPQQAYQLGFEYRDPDYWFFGTTANFFSNGYIDVSPITRTKNFYQDRDEQPFNDYNPLLARRLLQQEQFDDYLLINAVGGKSWKIDDYFVGFFATINNIFDRKYKTGGFEQGRNANYRQLRDDDANDTRVFGNKYFYGYGTTYYLNVYVRF